MTKIKEVNKILKAGEPNNITVDTYSGYTGYKPQSVVDAMNEVFGIDGWGFLEIETHTVKGAITTKRGKNDLAVSKIEAWIGDVKRQAWGQNQVTKGEYGHAKKSAQTDALKKALSYFSIGSRAYHGELKVESNSKNTEMEY
ncbi:MAG: Rad52/Rad22 family DNA repair protein [Candidatus Heimdallarchaeaceae archaeon]